MPYIGRSTDGFGVRNRFLFVASADDTSVSGADANGATLTFTDGAYVDVYLNGVLLKAGTDYNTNTANTIAGLSALSANDEVTVIVYDVFTVGDMVSAASGGTFSGAVTANSTLDMNGTELILDADADTSITADTDDRIDFKTGGTDRLQIQSTSGNNVVIADGLTLTDGNLIVASGHGIDFSATSTSGQGSMTSELLDVYEEGTFTPAANDYSGTMTFTTAYYTKIGRIVNFAFKMTGDGTTDSSQVAISGFPYAVLEEHAVSLSFNVGTGSYYTLGTDFPNAMVNTAEICYFYNNGGNAFTYTDVGSGYIRVAGTYKTTN